MFKKAKKIGILFTTLLVLSACGKKEVDEGPTMDELMAQQGISISNSVDSNQIVTNEPYVGYSDMRVKRGQFNTGKYVNASQQQFIEIDSPYILTLLGQIQTIDEEIATVLTDPTIADKIWRDRSYDIRGWVQSKIIDYTRILNAVSAYREPHPDTPQMIKDKYYGVIDSIIEGLTMRINAANSFITVFETKFETSYIAVSIMEGSKNLINSVNGRRTLVVKTDIVFEAIKKEYDYMNNKEKAKFDETNRPNKNKGY